jgi:hypothetical protein
MIDPRLRLGLGGRHAPSKSDIHGAWPPLTIRVLVERNLVADMWDFARRQMCIPPAEEYASGKVRI